MAAVDGADPRLREARLEAGLSQGALADAAGLSRQAVGAVESGRHRPSVDAALALAAALGCGVEALFGPRTGGTTASESLSGLPVPTGSPVLTAQVGERRIHAQATLAAWQERWPAADGRWNGKGVETWDPAAPAPEGFVVVGCDPAVALVAAELPARGPRRLVAVNASTRDALDALDGGRAHAAVIHGPAGTLPAPAPGTLRLHLTRWRVGVATAAARPPRSVTAISGDLVQRDAGATTQQALLRAYATAGAPAPRGPVAGGHLAVTMRVLHGARAGVTMEPAAVHSGLGFLPLEVHEVQMWIRSDHRDHSGAAAAIEVLGSRAFRQRLGAVGAYDLTDCGRALAETSPE